MEASDWRTQLPPHSRQTVVSTFMETFKKRLPISGPDGLRDLNKLAVRSEEEFFTSSTSKSDYLKRITLKILSLEETKSETTGVLNSAGGGQNPQETVSQSMQSQVRNQGQSQIPLSNQSQAWPQLLPRNIQNMVANAGVQGVTLSSAQTSMPNTAGQISNLQPGMTQNSVGISVEQGVPSNVFRTSQGQMQERQHPQQAVSQQQSLNSQQFMYQQQQLQHQILKQKQLQGNVQPSLMQSHIQQQPQQQQPNLLQPTQLQSSQQSQQQQHNLLQPTQLHSSQQSCMQMSSGLHSSQPTLQQTQPSVMQSASHPGLQQKQQSTVAQSTPSVLQLQRQSVLRQQQQSQQSMHQQPPVLHKQQTSMSQQPLLPSQQQQQQTSMSQQLNATKLQQNQLLGQKQQRQLGEQNNIPNLHSQQVGQQNSMSGLQQQQQQLLGTGTQSCIQNMQPHQPPAHIKVQQQQGLRTSSNLLQIHGKHAQSLPAQQQLISQHQPQPTQMQQQFPQQPNPLQREIQQGVRTSGSSMLNPQNLMDQKQVFHSQSELPETLSTSIDSSAQTGHNTVDWQEEVYQKIRAMRDIYLPDLTELHQKISFKCQQYESLPPPRRSEQIDKFKILKGAVYKMMAFLNLRKNNILPDYKGKLDSYEKLIQYYLTSNRTRIPVSSQQQVQPPGGHTLSMQPEQEKQQQHQQRQQSQIPQQQQESQIPQQQHDNQRNSLMQPVMLQNSVSSMQTTNATGMNGFMMNSTAQTNKTNSLQSGSTLESGQGNTSSSLQQVGVGSLQQSSINAPQQANVNTMSQSGVNGLQPNINSLQHPHLKQQLEQHRQMHRPLINQKQQQILQQRQLQQHPQLQQQFQQLAHQSQKPQQSSQLQAHQIPHLNQMNEDLKVRQGMGFRPGMTQQHHSTGLQTPSNHQRNAGASFPISSPQLLQVPSPQISQHSSPQIDQESLITFFSKTETPLQSANSPFIVPTPSIPSAPSAIPGYPEIPTFGVSNAGNIEQPQNTTALAQVQSFAIGTSGISASPWLTELTSPDVIQVTAPTVIKSSVTEQPFEHLIKVVKSVSPKAFSASVSDIGSVISLVDGIAGSAPGNGSKASVGDDLVAMNKCRMQAWNFITQDGSSATKRMRHHTSAMPLNAMSSAGSVNDSFEQLIGLEASNFESTATSRMKKPRVEANHVLLEEIRELNSRLIDTVVDISDEDVHLTAAAGVAEGGKGTVVKCSFIAVTLSPNLKSEYASGQMSPILPLRLLVPTNYPNCSPILLDEFPVELSKETEDLSLKAKVRFSISLRSLSQPMSLKEMVRTWDACARAVISEYAEQRGGGSFSSRYGNWENCVSAA